MTSFSTILSSVRQKKKALSVKKKYISFGGIDHLFSSSSISVVRHSRSKENFLTIND
jgi:hypothetical protein